MSLVSGTPIPEAAKLSDGYLSLYGVAFRSGSPYIAVVNLGSGHAPSGTKGIGGSTSGGILRYDQNAPIIADFFNPSDTSEMAITDFVSLRTDYAATSGADMRLEGYDIFGNLIVSDSALDTTGGLTLSISASGIHSVKFYGQNVAADDFTFNAVSPIPEPSSVALIAISAVGGMWIRKRFNS